MSNTPCRGRVVGLFFVALMLAVFAGADDSAFAQDAEALVKQVQDDLRDVRVSTMRRNKDDAAAAMQKAAEGIEKLKAADAEHPRLSTLTSSYERMAQDYQRQFKERPPGASNSNSTAARSGSDPGGSAPSSSSGDAAVDASPEALRAEARAVMSDLSRNFPQRAEEHMARGRAMLETLDDSAEGAAKAKTAFEKAASHFEAMNDTNRNKKLSISERGRAQAVGGRLDDIEKLLDDAPEKLEGRQAEQWMKDLRSELNMLREAMGSPDEESDRTFYGVMLIEQTPMDHPLRLVVQDRHDMVIERVAEVETRLTGMSTAKVDRGRIDQEIESLKSATDKAADAMTAELTQLQVNVLEPQPLEERLATVESIEANHVSKLREQLAAFEKKYGNSQEAILASFNKLDYRATSRGTTIWRRASETAAGFEAYRNNMAAQIMSQVNRMISEAEKSQDFSFESRMDALPKAVSLATKFDPDNVEAKALGGEVNARVKAMRDAKSKHIDAKTWPGHAEVKDAAKLAEIAEKYFETEETWGGSSKYDIKVVDVVVTGDWRVTKRDLTGRPTQYGLPILLAINQGKDQGKNVYRVYELTAVNAERGNAKPEPPFAGFHVGDSWYMRPIAIK